MGFLKDLEDGSISTNSREILEKLAENAKKLEDYAILEENKKKAALIRQQSGVGSLVRSLGAILAAKMVSSPYKQGRLTKLTSRGESKGPDYYSKAKISLLPFEYPVGTLTDSGGFIDCAVWDSKYVGDEKVLYGEWEKYQLSYLTVESHPEGSIIFRGNTSITISEQDWSEDNSLLEKALGEIFNQPDYYTFRAKYTAIPRPSNTPHLRQKGPWS